MKLFIIICLLSLTSCGMSVSYSPLDSYVKATNEAHEANVASRNNAQCFIDSLSRK